MEVLLTQRDALDAKMELIETKQQQVSAVVNLYRSLGGGWQ
jgi:outer membrane protein, multidrug efflux system